MMTQQMEYTFTERFGYRVRPKGTVIVTIFEQPVVDYMLLANIVVLTEPHNNPGGSVTNFCEEIATQLVADFGLNPELTAFIEHYPGKAASKVYLSLEAESFDILKLDWQERPSGKKAGNVCWSRISRAVLEAMIGEPFDAPAMITQEA